jgi:hypothetical protein
MRPRPVSTAVAVAFALIALANGAHAAASRYAGTYTTSRPGFDSTQALTLVLQPNGRATLTTRFPDLERRVGPSVLPVREAGSWRARGARADVRLTSIGLVRGGKLAQAKKEAKAIGFVLRGCRLISVQYSKLLYGEAGLRFDKAGCKG